MKIFLFALALLVVGCATETHLPVGFVVTEVAAAAPPPAPPKDSAQLPAVKVEVKSEGGGHAKVFARSRGESCGGGRCKVRAVVGKLRIRH